jgi:hypothetical protein
MIQAAGIEEAGRMGKGARRSVSLLGFVWPLAVLPATSAELIEAIGGERCGSLPKAYSVEFLAPDDAALDACGVDGRRA